MLLSTNLEIQLPTHPLQRYSWAPTQRYSYQHIHYNHTPGHQPRDTITNTSIPIILLDTNLLEIQLPTHCSVNTKDHLYKMTKATLHIKKTLTYRAQSPPLYTNTCIFFVYSGCLLTHTCVVWQCCLVRVALLFELQVAHQQHSRNHAQQS